MIWFLGIGLAILGGAAVAFTLWEAFRDWFADLLDEVAKVIRKFGELYPKYQYATEVTAILLEGAATKIRHKVYTEQPNGKFKVTTTEAEIPKGELPSSARGRLRRGEEVDITDPMEIAMQRRI